MAVKYHERENAEDTEKSVVVRVKDHAFATRVFHAQCVGCGVCVDVPNTFTPLPENIKKAAMADPNLGECEKPWSLHARLREINAQQSALTDSKDPITLESIDAKLDAIDAKLDRILRGGV